MHAVALCSGTNIQRKKREMRLIFQLSTIRPKRLNINFSFIWIRTLNHLARAITGERAAIIFMSTVLRNTVQRFFSHWRRDINPKRLSFFRKTFDTFLYFFTEYHLISYTWSTCWSQKQNVLSWSWSRRCCVPNSIVMFRVSEPYALQYYYLLSITIDCYQFLLIDNKW